MQLDRQTAENYGTIHHIYIGVAKDRAAMVNANSGNTTGFSQVVIDTYMHKVEFEFEKGTWSERSQTDDAGDFFNYDITLKIRQMNAAVRAWRAHWYNKELFVLIKDYQGNELLIGSDDEPLSIGTMKPAEQRATTGAFLDVKIGGALRLPI